MPQLDPLKIAKESLGKAIETEKRNRNLLSAIGPAIIDVLRPVLDEILSTFRQSAEDIKQEISNIKIDSPIIPEIKIPEIKIPEIKIPNVQVDIPPISLPEIKIPEVKIPPIKIPKAEITVKIPEIKIPDVIMPEEMNVRGWVSLMGVDINNPLPVQLRDAKGNPVNLFENLTQIVSGGGGGNMRGFVQIKGLTGSTGTDLLNADNRLRVSLETGGSGLTDAELRATSVPIEQVSGSTWSVSVNDVFRTTVASTTLNSDNRLRVSLETGGSGLTDAELRASGVPIAQVSGATWSVEATATNLDIRDLVNATDSISAYQVSGAIWSVSVNDSFRTTVSSNLVNADDRLRVSVETGGSGLTDSELRATAVPVSQVSGASWSVSTGTITVTATDLDVRDLVNATDSVAAYQVSGASWSVNTGTVAVTATDLDIRDLVNASDSISVYQVSEANWSVNLATQPITLDVKQVSGSVDSVVVNDVLVTVNMNQVSGANFSVNVATQPTTFDVKQVSGSIDSVSVVSNIAALDVKQVSGSVNSVYITGSSGTTVVVGDIISDAADNGGAPVKFGGIARTANPTAVAANDRVSATFDDLGRQLVRPVQVRDLIATAYVALATGSAFGTETTLLAASAGFMFDLIYVMGTNDSDAAISCDFRGVTAGNVLMTIRIPANGTAGIATPIPLPQTTSDTGNAWTVDLPDVTGTNVSVSALFTKEI